ncbi:unnamed protein product [Arctogadus glacialis]
MLGNCVLCLYLSLFPQAGNITMYSGLAAVSSLHKRVQQQKKKKKIAVSRSAPAPVDIRKADVMVFS